MSFSHWSGRAACSWYKGLRPVSASSLRSSYRLSDDYRNEAVAKLKGLNMNHLKMISDSFRKNGFISRTILNDVFVDILSEKQIRILISKMEDVGIIQKKGAGKYIRYTKTPDFPSFV